MIKIDNTIIELKKFPDGTWNIKAVQPIDTNVIISWFYHDESEFTALCFLTRYYQSHNCKVSLYMPYVPNARMDRMEYNTDICTLKYFAELINNLNFEHVYVVDEHSSVTFGCIKNIVSFKPFHYINQSLEDISIREDKKPIIFYPDEGAMKRYKKYTEFPYAFGVKNRDWKTREILDYDIVGLTTEDIKGKNVLIIDDICSTGGTFYQAASKLKEFGANHIYLYATHTEESVYNGKFGDNKQDLLSTGLISQLYTTNTLFPYSKDNQDISDEDIKKYHLDLITVYNLNWQKREL